MNIFRRLPLSRLLLLCGVMLITGISATAIAFALGSAPVPPAKPLADAVHDALAAPPVQGISARVTLTNQLLEGVNLATGSASGGELASSPLVKGGSGRLWIAANGDLRLELQAEAGDTEILFDGHTATVYDAASNTLYRYTPSSTGEGDGKASGGGQVPSVAQIEEAISHLERHADVSAATPTDVAGRPAYTVRVSPKEAGSLFAGAELSFDADTGIPLRAAVYSTTSSAPAIELAMSEVSYGPVDSSVFSISPPASAKVEVLTAPAHGHAPTAGERPPEQRPRLSTHGHGGSAIAVLTVHEKEPASSVEGLPKVSIDGTTGEELKTELGTILTFARGGERYVLAGSVPAADVEALAREL